MKQFKCDSNNNKGKEHDWQLHTSSTWTPKGVKPTYFICKYCHKLITAEELAQINSAKTNTKMTKLTWSIVGLTIVIILLTGVLVWQGFFPNNFFDKKSYIWQKTFDECFNYYVPTYDGASQEDIDLCRDKANSIK